MEVDSNLLNGNMNKRQIGMMCCCGAKPSFECSSATQNATFGQKIASESQNQQKIWILSIKFERILGQKRPKI
jgi:hypothetical protein